MADDDFASFMESAQATRPRRLSRGERVEAPVVYISGDSVFVDLGTRSDGRIPRVELLRADGSLRVGVGDTVGATVADPNAEGGPLLTVVLGREGGVDVEQLTLAQETGTAVEGVYRKAVKAGVEVDLAGVRAFCPGSQLERGADPASLVGQSARFLVLEVRDEGRSVVVSRRKVLEQEKAERAKQVLSDLQVGQTLEGEVSSIQSYGAFVDLGGVEGLVHISELSAQRVGRVEDAVSVGEKVRVRVLSIEQSKDGVRVRLSLKALQQPAQSEQAGVDEILQGEVVRHLPHGLIVATPKGEGLVPARELELAQGGDHRRAYPVGTQLEVVRLDGKGHKQRFSAKGVEDVRARNAFREYRESSSSAPSAGSGALAEQLQKLKLGALPEGPAPKAPPEPEPVPASAKPAPTESSVRPAQPEPRAGETEQRGAPEAAEPDKPRRRRIVSGRGRS